MYHNQCMSTWVHSYRYWVWVVSLRYLSPNIPTTYFAFWFPESKNHIGKKFTTKILVFLSIVTILLKFMRVYLGVNTFIRVPFHFYKIRLPYRCFLFRDVFIVYLRYLRIRSRLGTSMYVAS